MVWDLILVHLFQLEVLIVVKMSLFGVDMSSFVHIYNKNKDIVILGKGPAQGLDNATLTVKAEYSIIFPDHKENLYKSSL